ncbi:chorismate mutase type ii [Lucifera butyrica]|uniref:Chorismate mutase type ii n=1 Tax=Lucifera butyrica TaxID=1351585 RepID=A0A498RJD3_9FIRM|nr:chorismate mutase [Lucifera butyrica]VBB09128.1 chorismate mutase type ii [Lucifera butyrica]
MKSCTNLDEVRQEIDKIDSELISLIARRGEFVQQAAKFKKTAEDVKAPNRVEQVIGKVKSRAIELGADEKVVEAVYRAMISAFIEAEMTEHTRLQRGR